MADLLNIFNFDILVDFTPKLTITTNVIENRELFTIYATGSKPDIEELLEVNKAKIDMIESKLDRLLQDRRDYWADLQLQSISKRILHEMDGNGVDADLVQPGDLEIYRDLLNGAKIRLYHDRKLTNENFFYYRIHIFLNYDTSHFLALEIFFSYGILDFYDGEPSNEDFDVSIDLVTKNNNKHTSVIYLNTRKDFISMVIFNIIIMTIKHDPVDFPGGDGAYVYRILHEDLPYPMAENILDDTTNIDINDVYEITNFF